MSEHAQTDSLDHAGGEHVLVRQFVLRVLSGPDRDVSFTSCGDRATIGTHAAMDLVLRDTAVSHFHCEISIEADRVTIRDLGSRNGTSVDGVAVQTAYLRDGATIGVGRTEIRFELGGDSVRIPLSSSSQLGLLVGRSSVMRALFARLQLAARSDATVLLHGETGTGKEVAARSIHLESSRRDGPFVVVDCASIPGELLEDVLFGHEQGAFTDAHRRRIGSFEAAASGTLMLDEIGELGLDLQPKLLRVIETRTVQRVGGRHRIPVDVRIVAATNRDLKAEVNAHRFRADLYYRLAVVEARLPPLREHPEDIPLLVDQLLTEIPSRAPTAPLRAPAFLAELARHRWPGNVRELRNYLERCLALRAQPPVERDEPRGDPAPAVELPLRVDLPLRRARGAWSAELERRYVEELLRRHGGNVSAAARAAGVDRVYLHRLIARHRVPRGQ